MDPMVIYHNSVHAADVLLKCVLLHVMGAGVLRYVQSYNFRLGSVYFYHLPGHGVDHPGNNNVYETKTHSKVGDYLYNDQSVLENHHTATFFFMVEDEIMRHFWSNSMVRNTIG
jgi:hypothetical protein